MKLRLLSTPYASAFIEEVIKTIQNKVSEKALRCHVAPVRGIRCYATGSNMYVLLLSARSEECRKYLDDHELYSTTGSNILRYFSYDILLNSDEVESLINTSKEDIFKDLQEDYTETLLKLTQALVPFEKELLDLIPVRE